MKRLLHSALQQGSALQLAHEPQGVHKLSTFALQLTEKQKIEVIGFLKSKQDVRSTLKTRLQISLLPVSEKAWALTPVMCRNIKCMSKLKSS